MAEAHEIFLRDNGANHASTMAARQNLEVVRANALNKLWQEVAREEVQALALANATDNPVTNSPSSSAPASPDRPSSAKGQSPKAANGVSGGAVANGTTSTAGNSNKSSTTANGHAATGAGGTSAGVGKGGAEEVTWCTPSRMSAEDAWLFRETPKSAECTIA